ncbi:hypothetical protein Tco_0967497 [Tanacetum coccineum]
MWLVISRIYKVFGIVFLKKRRYKSLFGDFGEVRIKSLSVGSTCVVQEEGRFISNVHRLSRVGLADHQESPQDRRLVRPVTSNGIHVDPSKIEAVKNWKVPKTPSGIRSFLGLAGDVRTLMMDKAHASRYLVHSGGDKTYYDLRDMHGGHVWRRTLLPISWWKIYFAALVDIAEGIDNTAKTCVRLIILKWTDKAEIGESSLIGSELVQETTDKVVLIKEKLKAAKDCQKSYVGNMLVKSRDEISLRRGYCDNCALSRFSDNENERCMEGSVGHMFFGLKLEKFGRLDQNWYKRQQIRVEVGDKVMLEVSSWKEVVHFGKKEMLAPRYKYLADTNLHVHFEEIKVHKTLHFVEEPVEIIDREVKSLKRSRIPIVKSIGTRSVVMRIS